MLQVFVLDLQPVSFPEAPYQRAPVFSPRCPYLKNHPTLNCYHIRIQGVIMKVKNTVLHSLLSNQPQTSKMLFEVTKHHSYNNFHIALRRLVVSGFLIMDRTQTPTQFYLSIKGEDAALRISA